LLTELCQAILKFAQEPLGIGAVVIWYSLLVVLRGDPLSRCGVCGDRY
jgi:hypothetical protein